MARIKIKDLPKDLKVSKEELKKIHGGAFLSASLTYGIPVISGSYTAAGCQPVSNDPLAGINKSVLYYSDRNLKKNITEISDEELLEKLDGLPIYNWSY